MNTKTCSQNYAERYQAYSKAILDQPLPLAWLDMDLLDQNIHAIKQRAGNMPIRIASKSVRCEFVLRYILDADPQFQGLMCYHPAEAAYLAQQGFDNLLIAYPSMNSASLELALHQVANGKTIYFMVDSFHQAALINQIAEQLQVKALLCIDLDMSVKYPGIYFGVYRSPIKNAAAAVSLYQQINELPQLKLCALMGYEAQIAGLGDQIPGKPIINTAVHYLKQHSRAVIAERRHQVAAALQAAGAELNLVNGGGTGSIESTIQESVITEVTVGSGFYCSHRFDYYRQFQHQPAAGFALEVVRQPEAERFTCAGGGYIASGNCDSINLPQPYLPEGLQLDKNEGTGEVQTPLKHSNGLLTLGSPVFFRHSKAGELCERFNQLYLLRDGQIIGQENTYRGNGQCFE